MRRLALNRHNRRRRRRHGKPSLPSHASPLLQVVLRSINSSLSAYLSVTYNANFFDSYDVLDCTVVQAGLLMKVGRWRVLRGRGRVCVAGCHLQPACSVLPACRDSERLTRRRLLCLLPALLPALLCLLCSTSCLCSAPSASPRSCSTWTQPPARPLSPCTAKTVRCAALRCAVCAASMPRSRPPAYVPTCLPACQPFTPAPIVCPPAPAGLVKSYRLPTMDSEILQVLQACLPGTMLVPCTLLIAV